MQRQVSRGRSSTELLTIRAATSAWGIPSSAVLSVDAFARADGEPPPDVLALLGAAAASTEDEARVLRLRVGGQRLEVLVRGALGLIEAAADELLTLPAALQGFTPLVSHIALVDGKPSLFVISPERLMEMCHPRAPTPSPPSSTRPR
jgi:hypothetical protein